MKDFWTTDFGSVSSEESVSPSETTQPADDFWSRDFGGGANSVSGGNPVEKPGFLENTYDSFADGFEDLQSFMSVTSALSGATDKSDAANSVANYFSRASTREDPQYRTDFNSDLKTATDRVGQMESYSDKGWAMLDVVKEIAMNPKGAVDLAAESGATFIPSAILGFAGGVGGGAAGSVIPGVGSVVGAGLGAKTGMAAGSMAVETGSKVIELIGEEARNKGLDPSNPADVNTILNDEDFLASATKAGLIKGSTIAALNFMTIPVAGKMLNAPRRAADSKIKKILTNKNIDAKDPAAIKKAMLDPEVNTSIRKVYSDLDKSLASKTGKVARGTAAGTIETVSEGAGEYLGEEFSGGEGSLYESVLESVGALVQSTVHAGAGYAIERSKASITDILAADNVGDATKVMDEAAGSVNGKVKTRPKGSVLNFDFDDNGVGTPDLSPIKSFDDADSALRKLYDSNPEGINPKSYEAVEENVLKKERLKLRNQEYTEQGINYFDTEEEFADADSRLQRLAKAEAESNGYEYDASDFEVGTADKELKPLVKAIEQIGGLKVVFLRDNRTDKGFAFNGAVLSQDSNTIFINEDTETPHLAVLGHELSHIIEKKDAKVYEFFRSEAMKLVRNEQSYQQRLSQQMMKETRDALDKGVVAKIESQEKAIKASQGRINQLETGIKSAEKKGDAKTMASRQEKLATEQATLSELQSKRAEMEDAQSVDMDVVNKELLADIQGDMFLNPEFYTNLSKKNPTLFKKFADMTLEIIDKLLGVFGVQKDVDGYSAKGYGTEKYVSDIQAMRDLIVQTMDSFSNNEQDRQKEQASQDVQAEAVAAENTDAVNQQAPPEKSEKDSSDRELPQAKEAANTPEPVVNSGQPKKETKKQMESSQKNSPPKSRKNKNKSGLQEVIDKYKNPDNQYKRKVDKLRTVLIDVEYEVDGEVFAEKENAAKLIEGTDSQIDEIKQLISCLKAG